MHTHGEQNSRARSNPEASVRSAAEASKLPQHELLRLQRLIGNQAVSRLVVQRKPADIDSTNTLQYDPKGALKNVGAARASGTTPTKVINALLSRGWVVPNQQLIGGHLFGRAFGGPDNDANVVPWSEKAEKDYSTFETDFKKEADSDAQKNALTSTPFTASVQTKATFVDRPDLALTDTDLDTAGWTPSPEREARKTRFAEIADKFSHVPTSVDVSVTGLSSGARAFKASAADIAPAFKRNPAAEVPGFKETVRFKRSPGLTRPFAKMPDWGAFNKAKKKSKDDMFIKNKLSHIADRHPTHWGVDKSNATSNLQKLETNLDLFIQDPSSEQIEGVYVLNKVDVLHYVNHTTKKWACTELDGTLVAAFQLSQTQYDILITKGTVG